LCCSYPRGRPRARPAPSPAGGTPRQLSCRFVVNFHVVSSHFRQHRPTQGQPLCAHRPRAPARPAVATAALCAGNAPASPRGQINNATHPGRLRLCAPPRASARSLEDEGERDVCVTRRRRELHRPATAPRALTARAGRAGSRPAARCAAEGGGRRRRRRRRRREGGGRRRRRRRRRREGGRGGGGGGQRRGGSSREVAVDGAQDLCADVRADRAFPHLPRVCARRATRHTRARGFRGGPVVETAPGTSVSATATRLVTCFRGRE